MIDPVVAMNMIIVIGLLLLYTFGDTNGSF